MPNPLNSDDVTTLWEVQPGLIGAIPKGISVVLPWTYYDGSILYILIFHAPDDNYYFTDISDLPQATIAQLAKTSNIDNGILWHLPEEIINTISADYQELTSGGGVIANVGDAAKKVASDIGEAIAKLIGPVADTLIPDLTPVLVILGIVAMMYLYKKG